MFRMSWKVNFQDMNAQSAKTRVISMKSKSEKMFMENHTTQKLLADVNV